MSDAAILARALAEASGHDARVNALLALTAWVRAGDIPFTLSPSATGLSDDTLPFRRLEEVLAQLEADTLLAAGVRDAIAGIIAGCSGEALFGRVGLLSDRGFLAEAGARLVDRILPRPVDRRSLAGLLACMLPDGPAVGAFQRLPAATFARIAALLLPGPESPLWLHLRGILTDGARVVIARIQAQGLSPAMRGPLPAHTVGESPFWRLATAAVPLIEGGGDTSAVHAAIAACRAEMLLVHERIQRDGVQVDVVYGLEVLERCLIRLEHILAIIEAGDRPQRIEAVRRLLLRLALHGHHDRSLRDLARTNLRLMHQKIIERSASAGEHYIAHDRRSYWSIWLHAAGGGVLTVATAAIKVSISALHHAVHLAAVPTGLLYGANYAVSFVALQHLHLILATKQPAMTAATLAGIVRSTHGEARIEALVERTTRICHSQLAAALANVIMVALGAFAFDALWHLASGRHWVDPTEAQVIYQTLSPLDSGTVFYAALTGVILWASSLVGGWCDNFSALHRLDRGIAEHRSASVLGRSRLERWGAAWRTHIGGWGTNISLGMMLGMTPALGEMFGLPLDVRHVTLNSGILSLACAGLGDQWWSDGFVLRAIAGIGVMFVLNLGVSFALSLFTATRAFELERGELRRYVGALLRRALRNPGSFVLPGR
jgi:site-specific recombinase